jgi:hypothetical protein
MLILIDGDPSILEVKTFDGHGTPESAADLGELDFMVAFTVHEYGNIDNTMDAVNMVEWDIFYEYYDP